MGRHNFKTKRARREHYVFWYGPEADLSLVLADVEPDAEYDTDEYPAI